MGNFVFAIMVSIFALRPLGSTFVYLDLNQSSNLRIELVNDNLPRSFVFHFVRLSVPSDFQFMQCVRGMCYPLDSVQVSVPAGVTDTIQLDFYAGSEASPLNAIYKVYDANRPQDRDSIFITGQVPVKDFPRKVYYKSGKLYGAAIKKVEVYDVKGALLFTRDFGSVGFVTLKLEKGVYFLKVYTVYGIENLKIVEVE